MLNKQSDRVVLYMRRGCHVCARVKAFLTENGVAFETREVDEDPLTPRELWDLFNRKANRLRVPFTALNNGEDVVLGYDPTRLEGVFLRRELGGWQQSSRLDGERTYDHFLEHEVETQAWNLPSSDDARIEVGDGTLSVSATGASDQAAIRRAASLISTERFATDQASLLSFRLGMAVRAESDGSSTPGAAGQASLVDRSGGFVLGFETSGDSIYAVHERTYLSGVTVPEECYRHRVVVDAPTEPDQQHQYAITYAPGSQQARWYVDGETVYWAALPVPVEGFSLSMGVTSTRHDPRAEDVGRERLRVTCTPWGAAAEGN